MRNDEREAVKTEMELVNLNRSVCLWKEWELQSKEKGLGWVCLFAAVECCVYIEQKEAIKIETS